MRTVKWLFVLGVVLAASYWSWGKIEKQHDWAQDQEMYSLRKENTRLTNELAEKQKILDSISANLSATTQPTTQPEI